jgi:hypothetical protein
MMSYAHALRVGALGLLVVAVSACSGLRVHSFAEADLSRYRTYSFGPAPAGATGDPRLDNNRFFYERVEADVDKMLAARGYEKSKGPRVDVMVHYHASVSQQIELNEDERDCVNRMAAVESTSRSRPDCGPYVYDAGTLLIDLVDGRTRKLLWRGWAEDSVDGVLSDQAWMEQRIDESVRRILETVPPRL